MALSNELIMRFVRATKDPATAKTESIVYGTLVESDGKKYVRFDGSELLTPVESTSDARDGDRVTVMIKNHTATVTGNLSSPSARTAEVQTLGTVVAGKVSVNELEATNANVESLRTNKLDAKAAEVKYATIDKLNATNIKVDTLDANKLNADQAAITYATITQLRAMDAKIDNLAVGEFDAVYANIDFSNIGKAAMEYFYAQSGLIKNVVVGDQTITGELVGVTISGDRLIGNTVIAEKLVIKGSDGLYYKLNTDGMKVEAQQTDQNSLNGQVIKAKSITATKISVDDLVAFDATIGGFNIGANAIYSGVKSSIGNTTRGIYLGADGQVAFGDSSNFLKYYRDTDGKYKLTMSVDSLSISSGADIGTALENVQNGIDSIEIGGRNLILDSRLDKASDLWNLYSVSAAFGNGCVTLTKNATDSRVFMTQHSSETVNGGLAIAEKDQTYTISIEVMKVAGSAVPSGSSIFVRSIYTDGTHDELGMGVPNNIAEGTWTKLSNTGTYYGSKTLDHVDITIALGEGAGILKCRHFKLEKGTKATDWTPAPEDATKAISDVQASVDGLTVGGRNLLTGSAKFSGSWVNTPNWTADGTDRNGNVVMKRTGTWAGISKYVSVKKGDVCIMSANVRGDGTSTMIFYVNEYVESDPSSDLGAGSIQIGSSRNVAPTVETRVHSLPYVVKKDCKLRFRVENGASDTSTLWVSSLKVEYGTKATDWTPAPEDTQTAIDNVVVGGRNYIRYGKGNSKRGFFTEFPIVENGYGEVTLTSAGTYANIGLTAGFELGCRDYAVGKEMIFSYDIMYTKYDFPAGADRREFWMGQRYTNSPTETEGQWQSVTQHSLPAVGEDCELNKWTHVVKTIKIPKQAAPTIGTNANIQLYNSNKNVTATVTFRIKNVKLEYGNKPTDWTPAPEDIDTDISTASKTATNFISYDSSSGLQLGNKTGGAWSGFRTQITSSAFNILNSAGATLASYGEKLIELGKNATDAVIKLCGGKGQIEYVTDTDSGEKYLQMASDKLRLKSSSMSSLYSMYSDNSTRWEKSATNVYPDAVNMYASKCVDPTMVEKVEGWRTSGMDIKPTYIDAYSPGDILIRSERNLTICDAHGAVRTVQEGTSGIWTYKKWSNGEVELWGVYSVSNIDCNVAIGNMYRTAVFTPTSFPFTVYNPNVVASYESTGYGAFLWATTVSTTSAPPNYYLVRPTSTTIANGKINFHVRGKWKT